MNRKLLLLSRPQYQRVRCFSTATLQTWMGLISKRSFIDVPLLFRTASCFEGNEEDLRHRISPVGGDFTESSQNPSADKVSWVGVVEIGKA